MCQMSVFKVYSSTELWQRETKFPSIPTLSQSFDSILGCDGVPLGSITELIGLPGSGKTQLCLQLCASVQIPRQLRGLEAEALYIDTNTNFTIERFKEILNANLAKCQSLLDTFEVTEMEALRKLHYVNAFGLTTFCSFLHRLPNVLKQLPKITLIVIDSIVFPFKEGINARTRTGVLFRLMAELHRLAFEKQIAVVVTNEMSTRVGLSSGSVVGALGDAWSHRCNTRVLLTVPDSTSNRRAALIVKSNVTTNGVASFAITPEGIRDVSE